jgi:aspartyl-tRNA(Asn)/glutamyl-tRNA(Gln) amidotransferase subunit C
MTRTLGKARRYVKFPAFRALKAAECGHLPAFLSDTANAVLQPLAFHWRTPMALERSDVEKIAHLARLGLTEAEIPHTTATLNNILGLVDAMQAVDTQGVEPLAHPLEATQRLRADQVTETNQRDAYQNIAPAVAEGLYLVPKVIE